MLKFLVIFSVCFHVIFAKPFVIGIAGGTGSGKTTLAEKIQDAFPHDSILISQDSYYKDLSHLTMEERVKINFDHPNSLDFDLLRKNLIDLTQGSAIDQPIYNFHIYNRENATHHIEPAQLIIVEGILLLAAAEVRDLFDLKIFIDTDDDIRLLRRIERDMFERSRSFASIKDQYLTTVKRMHDDCVEPSKQYADIIIPMSKQNPIALDLIISKFQAEQMKAITH